MDRADLHIIRGTTRTYRVTVTNEVGALVDLTGYICYFRVKTAIDAASASIQKSSTVVSEILILTQSGTTLGQFDVLVVPGDTSSLAPATYVYDVWIESPSGQRFDVIEPAPFRIERGVTEFSNPAPTPPALAFAAYAVTDSTFDKTVFVDGVNGNDGNDGLLSTTALKTIGAIWKKFPMLLFNDAKLLIKLAGVGGFDSTATGVQTYVDKSLWVMSGHPTLSSIRYRGPEMVPFTPATGPSTAALDGTPATLVDDTNATNAAGKRTKINCVGAAPAWTANNLGGRFVRFRRAGVNVFFELPITENTADTLTVDSVGIVGTLLSTDTMQIVEPGARIDGSAGTTEIVGVGSTFTATATNGHTFERVGFRMVRIRGAFATFDRCVLCEVSFQSEGGSTSYRNCAARPTTSVTHCAGAGNPGLPSRPNTSGVEPISTSPDTMIAVIGGNLAIGVASGFNTANGVGVFLAQAPVSVWRSALDGIRVEGSGSIFYSTSNILGRGNTGRGIKATIGAHVRILPGNTSVSGITGSLADLSIDAKDVAYGSGAGQLEEVAGYNGNATRKNEGTATAPIGDVSRITTSSTW